MAKKSTSDKVDFDLSVLSLKELMEAYEEISDFEEFLNDALIETEEEGDDND